MRSPNSETPSLVVAALTFKRPEALERLIPILVRSARLSSRPS